MLVDSHVIFQLSIRRYFDNFCEFFSLANKELPEDPSRVFSLTLPNLNNIAVCHSAVTTTAVTIYCVCVVEETAAEWPAGWTLDKIDMVCKRNVSRVTLGRLDQDWAAVCEGVSG